MIKGIVTTDNNSDDDDAVDYQNYWCMMANLLQTLKVTFCGSKLKLTLYREAVGAEKYFMVSDSKCLPYYLGTLMMNGT